MALSFFRQLQKRDRNFTIEVEGITLPVKVREHDRAKRLTLRLTHAGDEVKVTTPGHVSDDEIEKFVHRNKNWIAARLSRLPQKIELIPDAMVPFMGAEHKIVLSGKLRGIVKVEMQDGQLCLIVPGDKSTIERKLVNFFKQQARKELDVLVDLHCSKIGVRAKQIRITDTTSRWGSCSSRRTLSFSWRIILAPPEVMNYLAAHEVAHLKEMNHSQNFWNLTKQLCPDTDTQKSWLRVNGASLHSVAP